MRYRIMILMAAACGLAVLAACGGAPSGPAVPTLAATRTPRPTFTHTPVPATSTPLPAPTAAVVISTPTSEPPTAVPTAATAKLKANGTANVRSGPGTAYARIGQVDETQEYEITGKNAAGDWWQFTYNGQPAWIAAGLVTANDAASNVQVAEAPAPPVVVQPAPQPQAQPQPQPQAKPQPTAKPAPPATIFRQAGAEVRSPPDAKPTIVEFWGRLGLPGSGNPVSGASAYKLRVTSPMGTTEVPFRDVWENAYPGIKGSEFKYDAKAQLPVGPGAFTAVVVDGGGKEVSEPINGTLIDTSRDVIITFLPR